MGLVSDAVLRLVGAALALLAGACSPDSSADGRPALAPMASSPIARCMNMGNALDSPAREGEWGYMIRRVDLERLKAAGFDTVRYPIRWSTRTQAEAPYHIEPQFWTRIDEVVRWGGELGLNVIINVHHYDELSEDPDRHEPRLEAMWDQIAHHFADAPQFLIFETINEPYGAMTTARTDALNRRLLQRIRQDNRDRWVILGTANWGNLDALEDSEPPYDPKAILTYHDYAPFEFTHQGAFWTTPPLPTGVGWGTPQDVASMARRLDNALKVQARRGMPVFVGEFGVYEGVAVDERARWIGAMRRGLEGRGLGWCSWDFATTLKAYDVEAESWVVEVKDALLGE